MTSPPCHVHPERDRCHALPAARQVQLTFASPLPAAQRAPACPSRSVTGAPALSTRFCRSCEGSTPGQSAVVATLLLMRLTDATSPRLKSDGFKFPLFRFCPEYDGCRLFPSSTAWRLPTRMLWLSRSGRRPRHAARWVPVPLVQRAKGLPPILPPCHCLKHPFRPVQIGRIPPSAE